MTRFGIQPAVVARALTDRDFDVIIAGGGAAAAALAHACARRALRVAVVAPGGLRAASHTLCAFADEIPTTWTSSRWPRTLVDVGGGAHSIGRAYARLDGARLAHDAHDAVVDAGGCVRTTRVTHVQHHAAQTMSAHLQDGGVLRAAVVVDATGPAAVLRGGGGTARGAQRAFGLVVRGVDPALAAGDAMFMDWSVDFTHAHDAAGSLQGPPSFLYALCDDDGTLLLEETSLAAQPPVDVELLRRRLHHRLTLRGTRIDEVLREELVHIPLGAPLPTPHDDVASFGSAASAVQPASGYSIARALRDAPAVADALVVGIAQRSGARALVRDVFDVVWSRAARQLRTLQAYGLQRLLAFDLEGTRAFFAAFFALPPSTWSGWLDGTLAPRQAQRAMWQVFSSAPLRVRLALLSGVQSREFVDVLGTVLSPARTSRSAHPLVVVGGPA